MEKIVNKIHATKLLGKCVHTITLINHVFVNDKVITISNGDLSYVYCGVKNPVNLYEEMISSTCESYPLVRASIQDGDITIDIIKIYFDANPNYGDEIYSFLV